jgi:cellulose synthase/poly-beta-1,6-N-acetylglucosamine synthase-like glycosyltransferase
MLIKIIVVKIALVIILALYTLALLFIFLYSIAQAHLVYRYLKNRKNNNANPVKQMDDSLPHVTVQLPVYNEMYVVERLIDAVCSFDYPIEKLEVQVLDDSTDESVDIIEKRVLFWKAQGIDIVQVRRTDRKGYKAGALEEGLETAKGEFIAIFDADFVPTQDFLQKTVSHFSDKNVGMVQTRWEHINKNYSLLTKLQAFGLDAHFSIEQVGRNSGNCFINFNGTAGIWRKSCIVDAGNWQSDTLTEDLDLSYRAQLKNWKFVYLEDVGSPAELPPVMSALKTQQYRWTKGGAEVAVKHLGKVLRSEKSLLIKVHGLFHLLNSGVFVSIITCAILSVPLLFIKQYFPEFKQLFLFASLFLLSFLILAILYWVSNSKSEENKLKSTLYFIQTFPLFLSVMMGLSLHNAIAVLEGYFGKKTPFIRTPKFNITNNCDSWKSNKYISKQINPLTLTEGLLSFYFLFAVIEAFYIGDYGLMPFHVILTFGFATVCYYSVFQSKMIKKL